MCHCPDRAPAGLRLHCDIIIIIIIIITIIIFVIIWFGSPVPGLGSLVHRAAPGS